MKRIAIVILFCLNFTFSQYARFSAGFSYRSGTGINAEVNYNLPLGSHERNAPQLKISLLAEPKPGLLGESAHARMALHIVHVDKKIETVANGILDDFNKNIFNYNPIHIKQAENRIAQYEALNAVLNKNIREKTLLLQENDSEKKQSKSDKELFFERKKIFESFVQSMGPLAKNDPRIMQMKEMIADLEKSYE